MADRRADQHGSESTAGIPRRPWQQRLRRHDLPAHAGVPEISGGDVHGLARMDRPTAESNGGRARLPIDTLFTRTASSAERGEDRVRSSTKSTKARSLVHDGPTASAVTASVEKTRRRLHERSPSSIESSSSLTRL